MSNATGTCPTCGGEICSYDGWVCERCGKRPDKPLLSYDTDKDFPPEPQMRRQMFNTMCALESMAKAVTDHLTADKQPAEQKTDPGPMPGWTTEESDYADEHHVSCREAREILSRGQQIVEGDLVVKGDLTVEGTQFTVNAETIPGPTAPLDSDVEEIRKQLDAHRKALALLSTFGTFQDVGFFCGSSPKDAIRRLVKLKACTCVGTGWVARDEMCKECGGKGYLKA